jgi:hypothetical protein
MRLIFPRTPATVLAGLVILGFAGVAGGQVAPPGHTDAATPPAVMLTQPIPDGTPNGEQLRRGQYLVAVGDCMSCHLRKGGEPLAGGLGLKTPFGTIYSSNITANRQSGIGAWTSDQFYSAMHDGWRAAPTTMRSSPIC